MRAKIIEHVMGFHESSVKNEFGLENYLGYQCTKFGEDRLKIDSARDYRMH